MPSTAKNRFPSPAGRTGTTGRGIAIPATTGRGFSFPTQPAPAAELPKPGPPAPRQRREQRAAARAAAARTWRRSRKRAGGAMSGPAAEVRRRPGCRGTGRAGAALCISPGAAEVRLLCLSSARGAAVLALAVRSGESGRRHERPRCSAALVCPSAPCEPRLALGTEGNGKQREQRPEKRGFSRYGCAWFSSAPAVRAGISPLSRTAVGQN